MKAIVKHNSTHWKTRNFEGGGLGRPSQTVAANEHDLRPGEEHLRQVGGRLFVIAALVAALEQQGGENRTDVDVSEEGNFVFPPMLPLSFLKSGYCKFQKQKNSSNYAHHFFSSSPYLVWLMQDWTSLMVGMRPTRLSLPTVPSTSKAGTKSTKRSRQKRSNDSNWLKKESKNL